jgi:DNA-binding XRE family transcriptional regulator
MIIKQETAKEDLLKFRETYGITQEKLSEETGISKTTIVNIETGKIKPQAVTIFKLNKWIRPFPEV